MPTVKVYHSFAAYFETADELCDKITAIESIISALYTQSVAAAENSDVAEYHFDDGQVIIRTKYRDASQVAKMITTYERLKNELVNKLQGHDFVLRDRNATRGYEHH